MDRIVKAWRRREKSKYDQHASAREKSTIEHRSSNVSCPVENVVHAQPSGSHEEDETQNLKFKF